MTVEEAILTLNANVVFACERAGFSSATVKMIEDALDTIEDALKAQKPRVMTWEEAKANVNDGPFIIFEVRDSTGSELDFGVLVDDSYEMSEGSLLTVEFFPKMEDEYGKRFRMWTSRPTNEQREATPWND